MYRILVVDDNPRIRRSLVGLLEAQPDWKVVGEASNGLEALARAQELHPTLILLDLSMPVMNGLEAARELTRIVPDTPILMLTMHAHDGLREAAKAAGVRAILSKEAVQQLVSRIRSLDTDAA